MGLLRASGEFQNQEYHLDAIMRGDGPAGITAAAALVSFVDAAVRREGGAIGLRRQAVIAALGEAALIDAAAVIGGFDGITRIADATGIPLEPSKAETSADFRAALNIDRFQMEKT